MKGESRFRLVSGYFADRTGRYWPITIFGYVLNLLAVPALALTGRWELAAFLIIAERMGKAIRAPARDAMLSHAARQTGLGWGFGLHEAMDQVGAIAGPLMLSAVLVSGHGYREAFGVLLAPAILSLAVLLVARYLFPRPQNLDLAPERLEAKGLRSVFWLYMLAIAFIAAGYADYALIAFHFDRSEAVPTAWIPLLYAIAMATDAIAALVLGRAFDRVGLWAMIVATLAAAAAAPLVFLGNLRVAAAGVALWGLGMGAQESVMRAAVAAMAPKEKLGTAFGTMNMIYGVAWFGGSALLGVLYDRTSPSSVALVSVGLQLPFPSSSCSSRGARFE